MPTDHWHLHLHADLDTDHDAHHDQLYSYHDHMDDDHENHHDANVDHMDNYYDLNNDNCNHAYHKYMDRDHNNDHTDVHDDDAIIHNHHLDHNLEDDNTTPLRLCCRLRSCLEGLVAREEGLVLRA